MPNKTLRPSSGRQYPLFADVTVSFDQIEDTGVAVNAIRLPFGAQIVGGALHVDQAFTGGSANALSIGDAVSGTRYLNGANLRTLGRAALTLTGYVSDGGDLLITPTHTGGAPTAGRIRVQVEYIIAGRAHENQPN